MINISEKNIVKVAKETNFIKDNVERVMRLVDVLQFIFTSIWKDKLLLKGGTAINLFYRNLPRLSVDIDFDYIGDTREEMEKDKENIWNFLSSSLYQKGYSLSPQSKRYFALDSAVFQYVNNAGNRDNIKIEINYLDRKHILPIQKRKIETVVANSEVCVQVLDSCELFGSKISALIGRCKPRDIYDVYGLILGGIVKDFNMLRKCTIFYNCIGGEGNICNMSFDLLDEVTNNDINRQLKPMLNKSEHFKKDVAIQTIKEFLTKLFVFTDDERKFVDNFNNKVFTPNLLFSDNEIENRIFNHPMAMWRCRREK